MIWNCIHCGNATRTSPCEHCGRLRMSEPRARRIAYEQSGETSFLWTAFVILIPVSIVGFGVYLILGS